MTLERPGIGRRSNSAGDSSWNKNNSSRDMAGVSSRPKLGASVTATSNVPSTGHHHRSSRIRSSSAQSRRDSDSNLGRRETTSFHSRSPHMLTTTATTTTKTKPLQQHQQEQQRRQSQPQPPPTSQQKHIQGTSVYNRFDNQNHNRNPRQDAGRRHHSHGSIPVVDSSDAGSVHSGPSNHTQQHGNHPNNNGNRHRPSTGTVTVESREPPSSSSSASTKGSQRPEQHPLHMHYPNNNSFTKLQPLSPPKQQQQHQQQQQKKIPQQQQQKQPPPIIVPQKQLAKAARKIIDELKKVSDPSCPADRRALAITLAFAEFDHNDDLRHNVELHQGAASALCRVLAVMSPFTSDAHDDEIRMIAASLERVFRGHTEYVHAAYDKCGFQLLPLLLQLLERVEGGSSIVRHADVTTLNLTRVLLYLSRVPDLRVSLARHVGMLDTLARVSTASTLNPESRVTRIRVIANLANSVEDNKVILLAHEGLLDSLLRTAHLDSNDQAREYAGVTLMDLASAPSNQIPMAKNEKLLGTLVKMVLVEKVAGTREAAITALQNLAFTKENRSRLVVFKQGIVLEALKKALSGDKNDKSRRRAAGALTNLACDETAERMGSHKGLLDALAIVSTKDESADVQTRAAMALTKLAASITIRMSCYPTLLDALVVASLSSSSNSVSAALRVKARDPENRESMAQHPGILDTLADMCLHGTTIPPFTTGTATKTTTTIASSANKKSLGGNHIHAEEQEQQQQQQRLKDVDNAMRALMHLTNEAKNRKVMCTNTVLKALVHGASIPDSAVKSNRVLGEVRDSAVRAIERLATEFTNRAKMARQEGLLVAIAQATEREAKLEKGVWAGAAGNTSSLIGGTSGSGVDTPSPQLQQEHPSHAFLAKPLLMSLLVAM